MIHTRELCRGRGIIATIPEGSAMMRAQMVFISNQSLLFIDGYVLRTTVCCLHLLRITGARSDLIRSIIGCVRLITLIIMSMIEQSFHRRWLLTRQMIHAGTRLLVSFYRSRHRGFSVEVRRVGVVGLVNTT